MAQQARQSLHRIGNTLNSLQVSVQELKEKAGDPSEVAFIHRLVDRLERNSDTATIETIVAALRRFTGIQGKRTDAALHELRDLELSVQTLCDAIKDQENMAAMPLLQQRVNLCTLLNEIRTEVTTATDVERLQIVCDDHKVVEIPRYHLKKALTTFLKWSLDGHADDPVTIHVGENPAPAICISGSAPSLSGSALQHLFTQYHDVYSSQAHIDMHESANLIQEVGGKIRAEKKGSRYELKIWLPHGGQETFLEKPDQVSLH